MANENRFSGLMGGLNQSDDSEPATAKAESKPSAPAAKKSTKKAAPAKSEKTSSKKETIVSAQSSIAKHRSESYAQVGMYLPKELHRKMKIAAAMTGEEMSAIAAQGIELWLKKNAPNI